MSAGTGSDIFNEMQRRIINTYNEVEYTIERIEKNGGEVKPDPSRTAFEPVGFDSSEEFDKEIKKTELQLREAILKSLI